MALNQWQRIAKRNNERLRLIAQESYVEMGHDVIVHSPVDTGLFRNNWFSGLNAPSDKTTDKLSRKPFGTAGGVRYTELLHLSTAFDLGDQLYFTNQLPYARKLEYGHSQKMAPYGMVRLAAAKWPLIVERLARKIR